MPAGFRLGKGLIFESQSLAMALGPAVDSALGVLDLSYGCPFHPHCPGSSQKPLATAASLIFEGRTWALVVRWPLGTHPLLSAQLSTGSRPWILFMMTKTGTCYSPLASWWSVGLSRFLCIYLGDGSQGVFTGQL